MAKELLALVNTTPNARFCQCHELLTLVNKPELMETGLYILEEKEQAAEDLKWHKSENGDHISLKKLTVEDVDLPEDLET